MGQALGVLVIVLTVAGTAHATDDPLRDVYTAIEPELDPIWGFGEEQAGSETELARSVADAALGAPSAAPAPVVAPALEFDGWFTPFTLAGLGVATLGAALLLFQGGARFVTASEVLQNDVRRTIFTYLKSGVGANLKQLTDDLSLTTTNAIWHLRKLEDAGLIHSRRFNGYKIFYAAEGGIEARRMSLSVTALSNANAQEVFQFVVAQPGTHQREIARALDVNHGTVRWHLKKLMDAELIVESRRGKTSTYTPTETGISALSRVVYARARTPSTAASSS